MTRRVLPPDDYELFAKIPVRHITAGAAGARIAVHLSGRLDDRRTPLICIPGFCRNMLGYADFIPLFHRLGQPDWPVVLIDLFGRGRSGDRKNPAHYTTTNDANDVATVAACLGIGHAVFLGQGHGGQVIMALAASHSHLIGGTILIDCGPVTHSPGLVRMRDNYLMMAKMVERRQFLSIARQAAGKSYPGATRTELDRLIARTHFELKNGQTGSLFDLALLKRLHPVQFDDVFEARWPFFELLDGKPLMLMRTQLTDHLQRATFERMAELRSDAIQLVVPGQGSPALLSGADEVGAIADFVEHASKRACLSAVVSG